MNFNPEMMSRMRNYMSMWQQRMRPMSQQGSMMGSPDWMASMRARMAQHGGAAGGGFGGMGMQRWQGATPASGMRGQGFRLPFIDRTHGLGAGWPGAPHPESPGSVINVPFIDRTGGR